MSDSTPKSHAPIERSYSNQSRKDARSEYNDDRQGRGPSAETEGGYSDQDVNAKMSDRSREEFAPRSKNGRNDAASKGKDSKKPS